MPDATPRLCKDCKFFQRSFSETNLGHCHRYPPIPMTAVQVEFTYVKPDDWCGEFKEKA